VLIKEFFREPVESELAAWLAKYENAIELLVHLSDLFAKLDCQVIHGKIDDFVSINGPVHIGEGTRVHSHVTIDGPVVIGNNVSIRSHAQLRKNTFIGTDCVVGHGADIKNSLCLNGAKIQDGTFVGDSIVGSAGRIGSGAILANRKFNQTEVKYVTEDGARVGSNLEFFGAILGDHVRIGANCVLSPGTIVGPYTWVGSGAVLQGTYGSDLLIVPKFELEIRKKNRVPLRSGKGEYEQI